MPDYNLISLPLIPDDGLIATMFAGVAALDSIWYYDASTTPGTWQVYSAGPAPDSLTTLETGKGYWVIMDEEDFEYSAPLSTGLPETPAPIKVSYTGEFLEPGTVPPTYDVYTGWNLVGLHAERAKLVSLYLQTVTVPQQIWGSLMEYHNYISFELGTAGGRADIKLGVFNSLLSSNDMEPSRGFWLYMMQPGVIVPH